MTNIELFDAYALHIFSTLYDTFPVPRQIDAAEIAKAVGLPKQKGEAETHQANVAAGTIDWLTATGFLIASDPSDHRSARLSQYVLAPKAFEALRVGLPKSLREKGDQEHQSVGDKIKALAKRTGKEAAKEGTKQLIAKAITFVIGLATDGTPGTGEA